MNVQNIRRWGPWGQGRPDCPSLLVKKNQAAAGDKLHYFGAMFRDRVYLRELVGPITARVYKNLLHYWLIPALKRDFPHLVVRPALRRRGHLRPLHPYERLRIWFQQDGASAHQAYLTLDYITQKFFGVISSSFAHQARAANGRGAAALARWARRTDFRKWPAHSPDLTPLDFYLWDSIKRRVYTDGALVPDLATLRARIT